MFFLINRIDQKGHNSIPLSEAVDSVAEMLRKSLTTTADGRDWIPKSNIIPISAFHGFVCR
jgi:hypothetical protein